jgi:hypothetical protein
MEWTDMAWDRYQIRDSCENGNEFSGFIKYLEILE